MEEEFYNFLLWSPYQTS